VLIYIKGNMQRRRLLALSAAAATTGLAGCSDSIPGTDSTEGDVSLDTENVLDIMHAPGTFSEGDHYGFSASSPTEIDGLREELDEEVFTRLATEGRRGRGGPDLIDAAGVDFWDVGTRYSAGPVTAITGNFSREDVMRRLQYEGLQYQANYGGYALIESDTDSGATLAVSGEGRSDAEEAPADISLILLTVDSGDTSSTAVMRQTIDVIEGDGERYSDAVEPVVSLVEGLGGSALLSGETFDAVSPEDGPGGSVDHEPIELGQPVSGTLTEDSTVTLNNNEFSYMDRYGFVGGAEAEVVISAEPDDAGDLGIVLYEGNGDSRGIGNDQSPGAARGSGRGSRRTERTTSSSSIPIRSTASTGMTGSTPSRCH